MVHAMIVCRSLTYAQRANRALERAGFRAHIVHMKPDDSDAGCVYAVKIREKFLKEALAVLREKDIVTQSVYTVTENGE